MIPRYTRPEMASIWEPENKFRIMLEIETLAAEKMEDMEIIPRGVATALRTRGGFNIARIDEIEREVKHDVIAFLTSVAEHVGEEARYVHQGMTSSDVLDTTFSVQLKEAAELLEVGLDKICAALEKRAKEHKNTLCIGRSHGIHAEPTTFGLKLAGHYAAFNRARTRLKHAKDEIAVCAISGAVGTYATVSPQIEDYIAEKMGLSAEHVSTQVIPRDRHAMFFATLGVIASSIENLAIEIRHLQRTEVREAEEFFSAGQKGSSAMPHKRNPILTENLTGLARLVRAAVIPAMENVALWHERDISHSSVERNIAPDATVTLDFSLHRMANVVENLLIYPETMMENLERTGGLVFSQRTMLALTQAGIAREDAYRIVQSSAMKVWQNLGKTTFRAEIEGNEDVMSRLDSHDLDKIFDYNAYLHHIESVFNRVFP